MNPLREIHHSLIPADYGDLFERILSQLQKEPLFHYRAESSKLYLLADKIARAVCDEGTLKDPLGGRGREAAFATLFLADERAFAQRVTDLYDEVGAHLERATGDASRVVPTLSRPLSDWSGPTQKIGLRYPFATQTDLTKQRLAMAQAAGERPVLRFPKLTISVEQVVEFEQHLLDSLNNVVKEWAAGAGWQQEDLNEILEAMRRERGSDLLRLRRVMDQESLGRLKREGCVVYLEYLAHYLTRGKPEQQLDAHGYALTDLARRLRQIEQCLSAPDRSDGDFLLAYEGCNPIDLRDALARGDAYDQLPIIGQISGTLGELTDPDTGTRRFHLGLKLKLGGRVMKEPDQPFSFQYHLTRLNPTHSAHQQELGRDTGEWFRQRVLKLAFLYFVVLYRLGELEFDPIAAFERDYLPRLTSTDPAAQRAALFEIATLLDTKTIHEQIQGLRKWLRGRMKEERRAFPVEERTRYVSIQRGILRGGADEVVRARTFFKDTFGYDGKAALKYLILSDEAVSPSALASLPVTFRIEHLHYYLVPQMERFSMRYAKLDIPVLPLLFAPRALSDTERERLTARIEEPGGVMIPYTSEYLAVLERTGQPGRRPDSKRAFAYRFTMTLLNYLALCQLRTFLPEESFVPILRLHRRPLAEKNPQDTFLRALSKLLAHLDGEGRGRASAQGFDISELVEEGKPIPAYKLQNALASLYADLPKQFQVEAEVTLERLAIVVVSSRVSDRTHQDPGRLSTLMGEVISLVRTGRQVQVERLETFADTYDEEQLYREPTVLLDLFGRLYQQGYREILYLAKAPFTSTLNLTGTAQELYFMSPELLERVLRPWPALKVYPIFFDKYAVMKLPAYQGQAHSLYVDDTRQLQRLLRDENPTRQAVVFFNLFNGRDFGGSAGERGFYNWVISYATLLNMHEGVLEDQHLREGLLYDGPRKREFLTFLTLLHFARYEAARGAQGGITLKLDAYENLLGDESLGALAEWPHATAGVRWNALAFLVAVRKIVAAQRLIADS